MHFHDRDRRFSHLATETGITTRELIVRPGHANMRATLISQGHTTGRDRVIPEVSSRVFDRKADAVAWEQDQTRRLRIGEWVDPRRGSVPLRMVAQGWLETRGSVKRRTRETDAAMWRLYTDPELGRWPVSSLTSAEVANWMGRLASSGAAPSSVTRALAVLRLVLGHAVADGRVSRMWRRR